MKGSLQEPSKQVLKLVHAVAWPHCQSKSMVSVWRNYHSGIAFLSDIIFLSHLYHHFVELHSNLNMLCHVQKVNLYQSDITELETSQLSYYQNAAKISTEHLLQQLTGETLSPSAIQTNMAIADDAAQGFWVKGQVAYFDAKVFNPTAKVYLTQSLNTPH